MNLKMKKTILGGIAVIAFAIAIAINVNLSSQDALSSVSLANLEALADPPGPTPPPGPGGEIDYYKMYCSPHNNYYKCTFSRSYEKCAGSEPSFCQ
jgi:hypothetical protein